jgi:hypothetical protein
LVLPNEENYFVLGLVSTSGSFDNLADSGEVVKMIKYYRSMLAESITVRQRRVACLKSCLRYCR